jgi:dipeptidyl-peptidase-4
VRESDLYVEPSCGGPAVRLTGDGGVETINGTFDWVYEEEFDCRDGWRWSPDGARIAYWRLETRGVPKFTLVDYTSATYPTLTTFAYPKTGERNASARIGVVAATGGLTTWMAIPGDTRTDCYLPRMDWTPDARELVVQRISRRQNELDVLVADAATGAVTTALTERDAAWIDVHDDALHWLGGGSSFTWISERDGWRSLYRCGRDGRAERVIPEAFDVVRVVRIVEDANAAYFVASPENASQRYLYRASLDGRGPAARITPADQAGWHDYDVSPDGKHAIHTYSRFGVPPRVELVSLPDHKAVRTLAANDRLRAAVAKLARAPVEFFRVEVGDGVALDGWLILPPGHDPTKKYPVLFHVYGEPAGQTVTDRWGGTNYLWHTLLAQQGYAVASIDNRGTPGPRGRAWRKCVHQKIGTLASEEQAAAARELLKRPYLDPQRVGVWGWSGGGSMTLNLLFRSSDLYKVGVSVAPVPDMRLYDTIYQERYMGLPQENPDDYERGSPITHAAGLKGDLLLIHGTGDDNCHYQGVERLANRLIELDKPFTLMPYPNRSHSISEGRNTTRHLYRLMTRFLNERLPPGPTP